MSWMVVPALAAYLGAGGNAPPRVEETPAEKYRRELREREAAARAAAQERALMRGMAVVVIGMWVAVVVACVVFAVLGAVDA